MNKINTVQKRIIKKNEKFHAYMLKSLLMKVKEVKKLLKAQHSEN